MKKISQRTKDLFNKLDEKLRHTNDCYRYRLGVNGLNEICLTDFKTMTDIKGNRNIQIAIKKMMEELK